MGVLSLQVLWLLEEELKGLLKLYLNLQHV
jgi:hypothetical protein